MNLCQFNNLPTINGLTCWKKRGKTSGRLHGCGKSAMPVPAQHARQPHKTVGSSPRARARWSGIAGRFLTDNPASGSQNSEISLGVEIFDGCNINVTYR